MVHDSHQNIFGIFLFCYCSCNGMAVCSAVTYVSVYFLCHSLYTVCVGSCVRVYVCGCVRV